MIMIRVTESEFRAQDRELAGWCLACGEDAYNVEPDARRYTCEACGKKAVYGAQEALIMGRVELTEVCE
jgi:Zn finger protein HypA/HybF involved in hydrogenase expression